MEEQHNTEFIEQIKHIRGMVEDLSSKIVALNTKFVIKTK